MQTVPIDERAEGSSVLASVWRYRWLILTVGLVGALAGYAWAARQPAVYQASTRLLLSQGGSGVLGDDNRPSEDPDRYLRNQAQVITSTPVLSRAAKISRVPLSELRSTVTAVAAKDLDMITIQALAPTGKDAAKRADAVASAYQQTTAEQAKQSARNAIAELHATRDKLRANLAAVNDELATNPQDPALKAERDAISTQLSAVVSRAEQLSIIADRGDSTVELQEKAAVPTGPVRPRPRRTAAASAVFALLAATTLAWWLNNRHRAGNLRGLPAQVLDAPLLGEIPDFGEVGVHGQVPTVMAPQSVVAAAYQVVAASLELAVRQTAVRTVLITSPEVGDGKTVAATNVAVAIGQTGRHVVLVDGDQRHRGLSNLCKMDGGTGLTDLASKAAAHGECIWLPDLPAIQVVPAGLADVSIPEFYRAPSFRTAMIHLREHGDLILIDSPALLAVPDAAAIAEHVDGVVVVVRPWTSASVLKEARHQLHSVGTPVLGYIINRGDLPLSGSHGRFQRKTNTALVVPDHRDGLTENGSGTSVESRPDGLTTSRHRRAI